MRDRPPRFHLDRNEIRTGVENDVDFRTVPIAVEEEIRSQAAVETCLQDLSENPRFENRSSKWVILELRSRPDSEEGADQAGIVEVELGSLDEPLAEVCGVGCESKSDIACLQDRDPDRGLRARARTMTP